MTKEEVATDFARKKIIVQFLLDHYNSLEDDDPTLPEVHDKLRDAIYEFKAVEQTLETKFND
jgi:hypothetical protein